jgi:hypothetical protein
MEAKCEHKLCNIRQLYRREMLTKCISEIHRCEDLTEAD